MNTEIILEWAVYISMGILTISVFWPFIRLFTGPSLPDRVVALDQIALIVVGIILLDVIHSGETVFVDIVLVIAFILTLGTMIISKFLFKTTKK